MSIVVKRDCLKRCFLITRGEEKKQQTTSGEGGKSHGNSLRDACFFHLNCVFLSFSFEDEQENIERFSL